MASCVACCNDCEVGAAFADAKEIASQPFSSDDAASNLFKHKITGVFVLLASIVMPLVDTGSDINTCVKWLSVENDDLLNTFGYIALGMLVFSTVLTAFINIFLDSCYSDKDKPLFSAWHPWVNVFIGLLLSLTQLRLPAIAFLQIRELARRSSGDINWSAFYDVEGTGVLDFTNPMVVVMLMKILELTFETLPQLLLQSFVVWIDILDPGKKVPIYLMFSVSVSFLMLSLGVAFDALRIEKLPTKVLATGYLACGLVVRVGGLIGLLYMFIFEWGLWIIGYLGLRYLHNVYLNRRTSKMNRTKRLGWFVTAMFQFWLPIGIISFVGDHAPFTVNAVLLSRRAAWNTGMLLVESAVCWIILLTYGRDFIEGEIDDDDWQANYDDDDYDDYNEHLKTLKRRATVYFDRYFVLPACLMVVLLLLTVASAVKFQVVQFGWRPKLALTDSYSSGTGPACEPEPAWLFRMMGWLLGVESKYHPWTSEEDAADNDGPQRPPSKRQGSSWLFNWRTAAQPSAAAVVEPAAADGSSSPVTVQPSADVDDPADLVATPPPPAATDEPASAADPASPMTNFSREDAAEPKAERPKSQRQGSSWLFRW